MANVQYTDIIIAVIAALLFSTAYFAVLGRQVQRARSAYAGDKEVHGSMMPSSFVVEVVRTFVIGLFIAYAVALLNFLYIEQAALLAFWLWIAFPVGIFVGMVVYGYLPPKLAVIYAGDWLAKLLIIACILTIWR